MRNVLCFLCVAALPACGGDATLSPSELLPAVGAHVCDGDRQCLSEWAQADRDLALERSVAAGRVAYDGRAAQACVDRLARADCATLDELNRRWPWQMPALPECVQAVRPLVPLGGDCASTVECAAGSCSVAAAGASTVCAPPRAAGDACHPDADECAAGLYCATATAGAGPVCTPVKPAGTPCGDASECASGVCDAVSSGGAACRAPAAGC